MKGDALTLTSGWHFEGHGVVKDFDLAPFGGGRALGIISGELDFTAASSGYTARGMLTAPGLKAGPMGVTFDGSHWGRPVAFSTKALYWNKDLFAPARLDPEKPPATLD